MRRILLSFKADVYKKLLSGEKIYEHRKVFPDGPIEAYLYVSAPVKAIAGIIHFGEKYSLKQWRLQYSSDPDTVARIDEYLKQNRFAMEILDFQDTEEIPLEKLRADLPGFVVPQMYYFIDNSPLEDYLSKQVVIRGDLISHHFDKISNKDICKL